MEGNLQIHPGDSLRAGFDFTMPGSHPAATASFYNGYVSLLVKCANGSAPALTIQLPAQTINVPINSSGWFPSGDQSSSLVYQGSLAAPDLCGGGVMNDASGATFTTTFFSTDTTDSVNFRFHYSDNTAGSWSATVQGVPTPFAKTVTSATLTPTLSLGLTSDHPTAIPGDTITYTATVTNTGAVLTVGGDFVASDTGPATTTVASYWDDIYTSVDGTSWTPLVGTAATAAGYTPAVAPPASSGLVLALTSVAATGVTYPGSGDPIVGTSLAAGSTAQWHYTATATLSASQSASLFDPTRVKKTRNSFHLEVTPANPNVAQPAIVSLDFSNLFYSGGASSALTNLKVSIQPPQGSAFQFNSTNTPALGSLASGASTSVSGTFTVPSPPAKASGQTDSSYFSALSGLEGSLLKARASASAAASSGTVTAATPPVVVTVEHLPIVSISKSGPATANAGTTETNPLALNNSGGATASSIVITDTVPAGVNGTVTGTPATLAPAGSANATAAYPVPGTQAPGSLTDTASVTWQDGNANSYGPVSSSFTTNVANPFVGATLTLSPTTAGPDAPGSAQTLTATLLDASRHGIAGQTVTFAVTGANPTSGSGVTDANGNATFTYTGFNLGADVVQASVTAPGTSLTSNTSTITWLKLLQPVATTVVQGNFFRNDNTGTAQCDFGVGPGSTPVFSQTFPDIMFNPDPAIFKVPPPFIRPDSNGVVFNISTRPFTDVTTDVNGNANGEIVAQGNGVAAGSDLINFYASFTGSFVVNQAGDLTFRILHNDGYILGVGGGASRVSGDFDGDTVPSTTPFNGYPTVAAWNTSSTGSSSSGPATVHFPAPGLYPFELDYTECAGGPLFLDLLTEKFVAQTSPLSIYVGYADGLRPAGSIFPFPWAGSPNVTFQGCQLPCQFDGGTIRIDNSGTSPAQIDSVTVDIPVATGVTDCPGITHFDIWPHNQTIPAGQTLILAAEAPGTTCAGAAPFDTSDTSFYCGPDTGVIPVVNLTSGGVTTSFKDTAQVLNTGGRDQADCGGNESISWQRIGGGGTAFNLPLPPAAQLNLTPFNVSDAVQGQSFTEAVAALDGAGNPVPSLPVTLTVFGPNAQTQTASTGANGLVSFTYSGNLPGKDTVQATAFVEGLQAVSNTGTIMWIPPGGTNNPLGPSITSPSPADGSVVTKPVSISATFAPPAGQTITAWRVLYQAQDPGPLVTLASGTGTPPSPLATFDPTVLPNDTYGITIEATASGGGIQDVTTTVTVLGSLKLGRFVASFQDMVVPVDGLQMEVARTYDSIDKSPGDFGVGWKVRVSNFRVAPNRVLGAGGWTQYNSACSFGLCFTAFKNSAARFVTVTFPDQHTEVFDFTPQGGTNVFWGCTPVFTARASAGTTSTLVPLDDTGCSYIGDGNIFGSGGGLYDPHRFQLTTADGHVYVLNRTTGLESVTDSVGRTLTVSASGVTSSAGPGIAFTRDSANRITKITGPDGTSVTYVYDSVTGDLTSATDAAGGVTSYTYSAPHQLSSYSGPGAPQETLQYDSAGRLVAVKDASGATTTIANDVGAQKQVITDPTGEIFVLALDDLGDVMSDTQIGGGISLTTSHTYDSLGRVLTTTDAAGATSTATYDANGNLTSMIDASGRKIAMTYGSHNELLTFTDPAGNVTTYTWDASLILTSIKNPDGTTETFSHNSTGLLTSHKDLRGGVTSYSYDANGNVVAITDPVGRTTTYTYDAMRRLLSETNAAGAMTSYAYDQVGRLLTRTDALGGKVTYTYNSLGLQSSITDPLGQKTAQTYDAVGRVLTKTDPLGGITSFTYDAAGRERTKTYPDGGTVTAVYDAHGRLLNKTDQVGRVTSYTYDADGRVATSTSPSGAVTSYSYDGAGRPLTITVSGAKRTLTYDANGSLSSTTDAAGHTVGYGYDSAGNLISQTDALGGVTAYTYNGAGDLLTTTDPLGNVESRSYDAAGELSSTTDGSGRTTSFGYDPAGNQISVMDPAGHVSTSQYDALNRLVSTTSAAGVVTKHGYDGASRPTSTTDGLGDQTTFTYDGNGNLTSTRDPLGHLTSYTYDSMGRMTSVTDALGGTVTYAYDRAGQLVSLTDPLGHAATYTYDSTGNIATRSTPASGTTAWQHDVLGRTTAMTNAHGQTTSFTYDAVGDLTAISAPDYSVQQTYDAAQRRTSFTDPTGTTTYTNDADGRPTSIASPEGALSYAYDGTGRLTAMTMSGGRKVTYGYDSAGFLASVTDWNGFTSTYSHDADGRVTAIHRGAVTSSYTYDAAGRLTALSDAANSTPIDSFAYKLDAAGRRTSMTSAGGTESYTLDATGRLTGVSYPDGTSTTYAYDAAGNRTSQTTAGSTTTYAYDSAGRLTNAGGTAVSYDADGNVAAIGGNSYSYDSAGRLVAAVVAGTSYTNTYDGDGVRVRSSAGGNTTPYLVDRIGGLPQVVSDGTTSYVRDDSSAILSEIGPGGTLLPVADGLGSIRRLVDAAGVSFGQTGYDVFGGSRSSVGSVGAFGFTGQQADPNGLLFLRARQYNSSWGRFMSPDPAGIGAPGTIGSNSYAYGSDDPVNVTDPSGRFVEPEVIETGVDAPVVPVVKGIGDLTVIVIGLVVAALIGGTIACLVFHVAFCDRFGRTPRPAQPKPTPGVANPTAPSISDLQQQAAAQQAALQTSADECAATDPQGVVNDPNSPCDRPNLKIFFPGGDTPVTTANDLHGLSVNPIWGFLVRSDGPPGVPHSWYDRSQYIPQDSTNPCWQRPPRTVCDEYPFFKTIEGGPLQTPLPVLAVTSLQESNTQGGYLSAFYRVCTVAKYDPINGGFFVIPEPQAPKTRYVCSK
jgi:RHS repeat-associated protein/uncharacterized repeat protein (TIGR01451 family)